MHTFTDGLRDLTTQLDHRGVLVLATVVALTTFAAGCNRTQSVEEIAEGTPVAVTLDDGSRVEGRLVRVDPDALVVQRPDSQQARTIARALVKSVETADRSTEPAAAAPEFDEIVVPAGADIPATLETTIASDASRVEDPVRAVVREPVLVNGREAIPAGSALGGTVTGAVRSGKMKGRAFISFSFDRLTTGGTSYAIDATPLSYRAEATKKEDATKIGIGAAAGTLVGAIAGGKKGAAVGAAVGGGAGTAMMLSTSGDEVAVRAGSELRLNLTRPLTVRLPRRR